MNLPEDALREILAFFGSSTWELQQLGLTNSTFHRLIQRRIEIQRAKVEHFTISMTLADS